MMHLLPDELVLDSILARLPVLDLLRYRTVCKAWMRQIDRPTFIEMHKSITKANTERTRLLVLTVPEWPMRGYNVFAVSASTLSVVGRFAPTPSIESEIWPVIAGCCDGIVCLWCPSPYGDGVLWNPATRSTHVVRCSKVRGSYVAAQGFGYDARRDTYKLFVMHLIRVSENAAAEPTLGGFTVECFDCMENNWREIEHVRGMDVLFDNYNRGAYSNGRISWLVHRQGHGPDRNLDRILTLDVSSESVRFTEMPSEIRSYNPEWQCMTRLDVLRDSVALFSDNVEGDILNVWILRDEDGVSAWTRVYAYVDPLPPWTYEALCVLDGRVVFWRERPVWQVVIYEAFDRALGVQGIPLLDYCGISAAPYQESMARVW